MILSRFILKTNKKKEKNIKNYFIYIMYKQDEY